MQLLRTAIIWVWLAAAGPSCFHSLTTGHQVQVRIPFWDVGGVIKQVTGYMSGQDSGHPPKKKKERPHHEQYWPPYGYYDPSHMYPPYYYPYPPYPPPTYPPIPTKGPTKGPTRKTTKKPKPPTTKKPPETTTKATTEPTTKTPTETTDVTTDEPETTEAATTEATTTEATTTEDPEVTTTEAPGRDLCQIYPLLPECRNIKSVYLSKNKYSSNVLQPDQKLSIKTEPHPVTSLCFYYPRLCMKPEEAQFVSLSDENGRPLLLISPADKKSVNSKG